MWSQYFVIYILRVILFGILKYRRE